MSAGETEGTTAAVMYMLVKCQGMLKADEGSKVVGEGMQPLHRRQLSVAVEGAVSVFAVGRRCAARQWHNPEVSHLHVDTRSSSTLSD